MKLKGQPFPPQELYEVKLPRGASFISLMVSGFPLGVNQDFATIWPKPQPPVTVVNRVGQPQAKEQDYNNPEWQKNIARWKYHANLYTAYRALTADKTVSFDTHPTDESSMIKVAQEFRDAGLSEGDVAIILQGITKASHIQDADIKKEKETF